jgi:succinyl-CoA synthetase beta subunit
VERINDVNLILTEEFLGIVRCDMIAESIVAAAAETGGFKIPVVVRLQGTNCDKGLKLVSTPRNGIACSAEMSKIENSNTGNLTVEPDFEAAAQTIVRLTGKSE